MEGSSRTDEGHTLATLDRKAGAVKELAVLVPAHHEMLERLQEFRSQGPQCDSSAHTSLTEACCWHPAAWQACRIQAAGSHSSSAHNSSRLSAHPCVRLSTLTATWPMRSTAGNWKVRFLGTKGFFTWRAHMHATFVRHTESALRLANVVRLEQCCIGKGREGVAYQSTFTPSAFSLSSVFSAVAARPLAAPADRRDTISSCGIPSHKHQKLNWQVVLYLL